MIRISPVRLIDENGEMIGVVETNQALEEAKKRGLDLVEISPKAKPPVCKILDFGQYKYQKQKEARQHKKKQKTFEVKGVRISMRIGENDLDYKSKQAQKFLDYGHKVRIELVMKGREKAQYDFGKEMLEKFVERLEGNIVIEQRPKRERRGMALVVGKK